MIVFADAAFAADIVDGTIALAQATAELERGEFAAALATAREGVRTADPALAPSFWLVADVAEEAIARRSQPAQPKPPPHYPEIGFEVGDPIGVRLGYSPQKGAVRRWGIEVAGVRTVASSELLLVTTPFVDWRLGRSFQLETAIGGVWATTLTNSFGGTPVVTPSFDVSLRFQPHVVFAALGGGISADGFVPHIGVGADW